MKKDINLSQYKPFKKFSILQLMSLIGGIALLVTLAVVYFI